MDAIYEKIDQGIRIDSREALDVFVHGDFLMLGHLAGRIRQKKHPEKVVTFVIDRNINYTDICVSECRFCAFYCKAGSGNGYVITRDDLKKKIEETLELGGTQILLQGGMNPDLDLDFYLGMLRYIKDNFPIHIHGFSPTEIHYIAQRCGLPLEELIKTLMDAGLGSIPGGGAEILVDEVRQTVSPNKCSAGTWLEVMRTAHTLGLRTTATMMFGHLEKPGHIIEHLQRIRDLQDETQGFTAFIPWTFQPGNTGISLMPKTGVEYLRVLALSRIFLDNVDNVQASWVTQGDKIAQTALAFGANDLGSTMIEENVVAAAGVDYMLPKEELIRLIQTAGYIPRQRDCFYATVREY
ncbi:MAG: dehypoxanthine futalosine cyclase [Proteobacteria bacterium]|nr:dehypoxanthine futalosine cyclase [Pseudomonadota bacterium]